MESSRDAIIHAGVELLLASGYGHVLPRIAVADAARAAGYTSGAAYRHWSSQEAFERDVVIEALRRHPGSSVTETVANIRDRVDLGAEFREVIRAGAEANLHAWPQGAAYFALLALRTLVSHDVELRTVGRERLMIGLSEYSYLYEAMLMVQGRRLRPPLTVAHVALVFAALGEGFALQSAVGVEHPIIDWPPSGPADQSTWTLLAVVVEAIVDALTEPIE